MATRFILMVCTFGLTLALASPSFAQSSDDPSGAGRNKKKEAGELNVEGGETVQQQERLLAGPSVEPAAEQGRDNPMNAPNNVDRRRAGNDQNIPMRQWLEVVRGLGLNSDQQQKIAAIATEFQTTQRDFQAKHGQEMQRLQQQVRESRAAGKEPDPKIREQFQQLEADMPKQVDYQKRIWETLNAEQQATMRTRLAEMTKQRQQQRRGNAGGSNSGGGATGISPSGGGGGASGGSGGGAIGVTAAEPAVKKPGPFNPASKLREKGVDVEEGDQMAPNNDQPRLKPGAASEGEDMMTGSPAADAPRAEPASAETVRERMRDRRRAGEGRNDAQPLDQAAQQRVDFLRKHQSAAVAGNAPSPQEQRFQFAEDSGS